MKKINHTLGPWVVKQVMDSMPIISSKTDKNGDKLYIGHLFASEKDSGFNLSMNEIKANAQLIAAAPELLEALIELTEVLRQYGGIPSKDPFKYDKLIAKAKGDVA